VSARKQSKRAAFARLAKRSRQAHAIMNAMARGDLRTPKQIVDEVTRLLIVEPMRFAIRRTVAELVSRHRQTEPAR
jgi:hypothetical protein